MEKDYVVCDAGGAIIEWGQMTEELIKLNAKTLNKTFILGFGRPETHRVDVTTLTIVPNEQK